MPYKFPGSALLGTRLANGRNRKLIRMDGRQPGAVWLHGKFLLPQICPIWWLERRALSLDTARSHGAAFRCRGSVEVMAVGG